MKKIGSSLIIFCVFIIIYLLQANFFTWFTIAGVKPNLFVILILFVGLFAGKYMGITTGVVIGFLIDLFIGKKIGISSIMLGIIGIVGGYLDKNFSKDSKLTIILMVMVTTLLYEIGTYLIYSIIYSYSIDLVTFSLKLVIEILYNAILTIIIYPIFQRAGTAIETIFKGNKILTRYF